MSIDLESYVSLANPEAQLDVRIDAEPAQLSPAREAHDMPGDLACQVMTAGCNSEAARNAGSTMQVH